MFTARYKTLTATGMQMHALTMSEQNSDISVKKKKITTVSEKQGDVEQDSEVN